MGTMDDTALTKVGPALPCETAGYLIGGSPGSGNAIAFSSSSSGIAALLFQHCLSHNFLIASGCLVFATHSPFKIPVPLAPQSTAWRGVELATRWPVFIVTMSSPQEGERTFFMSGTCDIVEFVQRADLGGVTAVDLLLSPAYSSAGCWEAIPIAAIDRRLEPEDPADAVALTARDGRIFGGVPVGLLSESHPGPSERVADLTARPRPQG